jgi:hypothetical protein
MCMYVHECDCICRYCKYVSRPMPVEKPCPYQLKTEGIKPKYCVGLPLMLHVFSHMLPSCFTPMQSLGMVLQPAILTHTAHMKAIQTKYSHSAHIPATYLHIPAHTCKYLQHTYCFICRYVVGILCKYVVGIACMCRYSKHGKLLAALIPTYIYNTYKIPTRYLQDTYKIPTRYLQIPAHKLRVNMGICRYVTCRYVQVLHECAGI